MNHLHRELAPITDAAWAEIEEEARRTYKRYIAGRRVVDVEGPKGYELAAVPTGHVKRVSNVDGVERLQRQARLVVELRVPFTVSRDAVDSVDRGAEDADWQPVKDAVEQIALAEDRVIFNGAEDLGIEGVIPCSSNEPVALPNDVTDFPDAVSKALTELRLAGVNGPYALLLDADLFTRVSEATQVGGTVFKQVQRIVDGPVLWAPALTGALLLSTRGGDYELTLGQDLSIGYLSHDADSIRLYHEETFTFRALTAEASVVIR